MRVDHKSFYADLFTKKAGPERGLVAQEPPAASPPAPTLPVVLEDVPALLSPPEAKVEPAADEAVDAPVDAPADSPRAGKTGVIDTHHLSPRQMVNFSLDLYAAGAISFEDYSLLAFQPELQPGFERTIGALTGEVAEPDRPRDFVRIWDDRAAFHRRHNNARRDLIEQSERIATVLRQIDAPLHMVA